MVVVVITNHINALTFNMSFYLFICYLSTKSFIFVTNLLNDSFLLARGIYTGYTVK